MTIEVGKELTTQCKPNEKETGQINNINYYNTDMQTGVLFHSGTFFHIVSPRGATMVGAEGGNFEFWTLQIALK